MLCSEKYKNITSWCFERRLWWRPIQSSFCLQCKCVSLKRGLFLMWISLTLCLALEQGRFKGDRLPLSECYTCTSPSLTRRQSKLLRSLTRLGHLKKSIMLQMDDFASDLQSEVDDLPKKLLAIPEHKIQQMQIALSRVWHRFAYSSLPVYAEVCHHCSLTSMDKAQSFLTLGISSTWSVRMSHACRP